MSLAKISPKKVFIHKRWFFPIAIVSCLLLATGLKLSGSSFGPYYENFLHGHNSRNLITGQTRPIRSDEWMVVTQSTIAQREANYPLVNPNFGEGKDMSLISDAPYREWSVIFRPQNLAFFVLPFEYAFAFKWWFLLTLLLLSVYFLALKFLPGKYLIASLVAVIGAVTPFVFWWYQTITLLSIAWGIIALLLAMRMVDNTPLVFCKNSRHPMLWSRLLLGCSLTYVLVAFAILLYPAFQIPVVLSVSLLFIGYILMLHRDSNAKKRRSLYVNIGYLMVAAVAAIAIVAIFLLTRLDSVKAISGTDYPGTRFIASGTVTPAEAVSLASYSQFRLADDSSLSSMTPDKGIINQSELSAFLVMPFAFLIPIGAIVALRWRKERLIDWVGVAIIITSLIFIAHMFVPGFSGIVKPLGLYLIPLARLQIGLGLIGIICLIYTLARSRYLQTIPKRWLYGYSALVIVSYIATIPLVLQFGRQFAGDLRILLFSCLALSSGIVLLFLSKRIAGLAILAALCLLSTMTVQPLYRGLGVGYQANPIIQKIKDNSSDDAVWGLSGTIVLENFPQMANRRSVTGVHSYPDLEFWSQVTNEKSIYNRYAHVLLSDTTDSDLTLLQPDLFVAKLSCDNHIGKTVTHILATTPVNLPCYQVVDQAVVHSGTILFYKRTF